MPPDLISQAKAAQCDKHWAPSLVSGFFPWQSFFTAFLLFSLGAFYLELTEKQRGCSRYLPSHYLQAGGRRHCHLCFLPLTPIICCCLYYSELLHCFISGIVYPACHHGACNPDFLECCTLILRLRCSMIAQPQLFLSPLGWITAWCFPLLVWEPWPWSPNFLPQLHWLSPSQHWATPWL